MAKDESLERVDFSGNYIALKDCDEVAKKVALDAINTLHSVIDSIDNLIFYKDVNYRYLGCNRAFELFYGHTREEIVGHDDFEFLSHKLAKHFRSLDKKVIEKGTKCISPQWVKYPDGRDVFLHTTIFPFFDVDGKILGLIGNAIDITKEKLQSDAFDREAHYDDLTNLPNRTLFIDRLEQAIKSSKRHKNSFGLLFMDLDKFKFVNDNYGHVYGDEVLKEVSKRFASSIRACDTVARIGGDEFALIVTDLNCVQNAIDLANKLIQIVDKPIIFRDKILSVTLSVGIAIYPEDATKSDTLLMLSDNAMYKAKESGRNCFVLASDIAH